LPFELCDLGHPMQRWAVWMDGLWKAKDVLSQGSSESKSSPAAYEGGGDASLNTLCVVLNSLTGVESADKWQLLCGSVFCVRNQS
jgi:hypothetical protein